MTSDRDRRNPFESTLGQPAATFEEEFKRLGLNQAGFDGGPVGGAPEQSSQPKLTSTRVLFMTLQFQTFQARAMLAHAEITSGAYKLHKTQVGCGRNEDGTMKFRDMTDDEKLTGMVERMNAHIRFMQEHVDCIGEALSKEDEA